MLGLEESSLSPLLMITEVSLLIIITVVILIFVAASKVHLLFTWSLKSTLIMITAGAIDRHLPSYQPWGSICKETNLSVGK